MGAQLSNYGLKYDDIRNEADDHVAGALEVTLAPTRSSLHCCKFRTQSLPILIHSPPQPNYLQRLSPSELSDRNKRLKRAVDLSLKHT